MEIILATHNLDKCKELQESLSDYNIKILTLSDFPEIKEIIEDGNTLEENAFIKSRTVFNLTKIPTISDDTGLEVDALKGAPGIYSARYAGPNASYNDNVSKMLKELKGIDQKYRTATFKTVVTFVSNDLELVSEGSVKGFITEKPYGNSGFGYDPIFYVSEKNKTFSEMNINEKKQCSHRGKAIANLKQLFKENNIL
ncbi:MAG: non-canonical purine NTP pyrophosphatase, RdgB/HAM1 family [Candidatus Marinimicrobia bacterium]|nr:non-canonical purine NTP pyrophosphatase, RdgB/HAM1 family [Candidatus Neomarinimicrobiota bacterium]|tara:strand:+ start:104 stop:697 length:594 start_codon:yes stop_codon:yes gene_type:complete